MKKALLAFLFASFTALVSGQTYIPADEGSKVRFVIKNFGINTGGTFNGIAGTVTYDPNNLSVANFDVSLDAQTLDTDIEARDRHLRKAEYFDVEKFPRLSFKSSKVTNTNTAGYLYMFGNLTIKGVTKEVKFPFKANLKDGGYLFEGEFEINRKDFGVGGKSFSMGDAVKVELSVLAKKQ